MSIKSDIVKEYLKKYPKLPSLSLAKLIYKNDNKNFTSVENIRTIIRRLTGKHGEYHRRNITDKRFIKKEQASKDAFHFIPESHIENALVWKLPKQYKKVLLINDIHIPYHNVNDIKACFKYAKAQGVDCVYINGDLVDYHDLSFHEKDRRKRPDLAVENEMAIQFLRGLKEYFGCKVFYKPANHEKRLERFLVVKAPEFLGCPEFRLDVLLRLGEIGIEYIGFRDKCYFGKLLVEHGDRIKGNGGVNPAQTLYRRYKRHTICGHFHKKTEFSAKIYDGNCIVTYSVGSLCDLEPEYFEVNEHVNGFAIIDMDGDEFRVNNYTIEKGKVY